MLRLAFETHSITEDNENGVATGWLPGRLSAAGREAAARLGRRRPAAAYDAVLTSDLDRAIETCRIAFGGQDIPVHQDSRLRECNYGDLNGQPVASLLPRARFISRTFPNGESYLDVVERVRSFLSSATARWPQGNVIVVGHSATRWSLDHLLLKRDLAELVDADFEWRPGWEYSVEPGFSGGGSSVCR